jgi:hypothetical protein
VEGPEIKDFTTTSFGLVLAYLLPGIAALISVALWFRKPSDLWCLAEAAVKEEGGAAALVFLGLLLAFLLGAIINGIRMCTVDYFARKFWEIKPSYFSELKAEELACVTAAIDEFYRFYQFFGSLIIVAIASLLAVWPGRFFAWTEYCYPLAVCLALLVSFVPATLLSRKYYVEFAKEILGIPPEAHTIQVSPSRAAAGKEFELFIKGQDFSKESKVEWNGVMITTTDFNARRLHAKVPAANVTKGKISVVVITKTKPAEVEVP